MLSASRHREEHAMRSGTLRRRWRLLATFGGLAAASAVICPLAHAQGIGYTGSIYVSRTTYPTTAGRSTSISIFNSVDVTAGAVRASVSVPLVRETTTFTGETVDQSSGSATRTGFGDPLIRVDVRALDDRARALQVTIAGSVKPGLVDPDDGFGTGETDVAAGATVFKGMGRTSFFGDVLYWKYGDPEGIDFRDTISYGIGVARAFGGGRWSGMATVSGFQHGIEGAPPPLQLSLAVLALTGDRQSLAVTTGIGLTDGSEGFSIGTSWRIAH